MPTRDERNNYVIHHIAFNIDEDKKIDENMSQFENISSSESQRENDRKAKIKMFLKTSRKIS